MISFYVVVQYVVEVGLGIMDYIATKLHEVFFILALLVYFNLIGFNYNFPHNNLSHRFLCTPQKREEVKK